jgi:serine/threonine-protein kinase HipA
MTDVLAVSLAYSDREHVRVGRLAMDGNAAVFEYDASFASSRLSINPWLGPVEPGLVRPRDPRAFDGLHGVFADSLPDAWGRLVFDRRLQELGVSTRSLTVLDRLAYVGCRGRGALVYEPVADAESERNDVDADLDLDLGTLAAGARAMLEGDTVSVLRELALLGGSSGGARPKVDVALDEGGGARPDDGRELPSGFTSWIVKFRSGNDFVDSGPLEVAYAEAARRAGIDMPRTRLIESGDSPGFFATQRFDRRAGGRRVHMLSAAGLLDADWTVPAIDYDGLLNAVRFVTRDENAVCQMYRRMVFNVLAMNRDDHLKQHSFLLDRDGIWKLAPAYDLTLSRGPGGEHYLAINGRGTDIRPSDLLKVAADQSISATRARATVDEVSAAVEALPAIARDVGVSNATLAELRRAIAR